MRIFLLEDMKERHEAFRKKFPKSKFTIAETADEAINILSHDLNWDLILLDHDLGNRVNVSSNDNNVGVKVAKFLQDKEIKCPIIIHSLNWCGALNMKSYLPKAHYCPGFFLLNEYPKYLEEQIKIND